MNLSSVISRLASVGIHQKRPNPSLSIHGIMVGAANPQWNGERRTA